MKISTLRELREALDNDQYMEGVTIQVDFPALGLEKCSQYLFQALTSGKFSQGLTLNLHYNHLGPDGAQHLFQALTSGQCPQGLSASMS